MKWHNEPWRKLYTKVTGEWMQLSLMARGMAAEFLKYAKDDGTICKTRGKSPALAVALVLSPQPQEIEAAENGAQELFDYEYLVLDDDVIRIRSFENAQERHNPASLRQKRWRDKKTKQEKQPKADPSQSETSTETSTVTHDETSTRNAGETTVATPPLRGNDTKRDDTKRDEVNTHARGNGDSSADAEAAGEELAALWMAWRKSGLPQMVLPCDMATLYERLYQHIRAEEFPAWCAAFKRLTDGWRANNAPSCGATPMLMLEHLDKVELVLRGDLDPFAKPASARGNKPEEQPRKRMQTAAELEAKRKASGGAA